MIYTDQRELVTEFNHQMLNSDQPAYQDFQDGFAACISVLVNELSTMRIITVGLTN